MLPAAIDASAGDENIFRLRAIGAGIHPQRAADRPGMPRKNERPARPACRGGGGKFHIRHGGTRAQGEPVDGKGLERLAKPDHDAFDAAVAQQNVGPGAKHQNRDRGIETGQKIGEIALVGGLEEHLRRAARLEPGQMRQRRVARKRAAQIEACRSRQFARSDRERTRGSYSAAPT